MTVRPVSNSSDSRRTAIHNSAIMGMMPTAGLWLVNYRVRIHFLMWVFLAVVTQGCFGYRIGTRSLYRNDVRTINVPVVRSDSFRPELGVQLTEAVQKEIERRTPYKLADAAVADSVMAIRLTSDSKRVVGETNTDEPRLLESVVTIEMRWTDRRGMDLVTTSFPPPGETTHYFADRNDFVPEAGQSVATSFQRLAERLADHIVDQMESRW